MPSNVLSRLWSTVQGWVKQNAVQATVRFIPDESGEPVQPNGGYLRVVFVEGFLAQQRSWGTDRFPALYGGVSLSFLGGPPAGFTTFSRPPDEWAVPGARLNYPMTALLPYTGGVVEVQAALYEASSGGPLGTAVELFGGLASLMGPPLSNAAQLIGKVSDGLDRVLAASGSQPVLGLHDSLVSPGAGGHILRPGHFVMLAKPESELPGTPVIENGRLHLKQGEATRLPDGVDYLVVRVECRTERDDWRFPELDALIRAAGDAYIRGHRTVFAERRTEVIARAWNCTDLVANDRKRVALLIKEELDALRELGIAPGPARALEVIAPKRILAPDDDSLRGLTLDALLSA